MHWLGGTSTRHCDKCTSELSTLSPNCYAESNPLVSCCSPSPLADTTSATAAEAGIHSRSPSTTIAQKVRGRTPGR